LLEAAERNCARQQCEEAIGLLEEAVCAQPGNAELYYELGFCHSGGCRHHRLVDPDMAEEYLRHALSLAGAPAARLLRAKALGALGNTLVANRKGSQTARLRQAIASHQEAAAIYGSSGGLRDEWAREEFNQANVWCDLPEAEFPEKWAEAVKHYENALQARTKSKDPKRYAATVMNLGTALRQLPAGDRAVNVLKAIRCYRGALRVYTASKFPAKNANLCNNLGNACLSCPAHDERAEKRHARHALRHFEHALRASGGRDDPGQYALVQYNRGCAYLRLGVTPENVAGAIACLADAYHCALTSGHAEIARLAKTQMNTMLCPLD